MPEPDRPATPRERLPRRLDGSVYLLLWFAAGAAAAAPAAWGPASELAIHGTNAWAGPGEVVGRFLMLFVPLCLVGSVAAGWPAVRTRFSPVAHRRIRFWGWLGTMTFYAPLMAFDVIAGLMWSLGLTGRTAQQIMDDSPVVEWLWFTAFWWGLAAALLWAAGAWAERGTRSTGCESEG